MKKWWWGLDSNQRTQRERIYSPSPLTTRPPHQYLKLYSYQRICARYSKEGSKAPLLMANEAITSQNKRELEPAVGIEPTTY